MEIREERRGRGRRRNRSWTALALAGGMLLAACGGNDSDGGGDSPTTGDGSTTTSVPAEGVFLTAAGGQGYEAGDPRQGGEITVGMESIFLPLDPAATAAQAQMSRSLYGALLDLDDQGAYVGAMAEGISSNDDYTTWTLKLRPGINFTDGTPYDAAAVVYNIERLLDPATKYSGVGNLSSIESVTASDPLTVVFQLNRPYPVFPALLLPSYGTSFIASPKALAELGSDFGRRPVGAGPFMVQSWTESTIVMVRNPDYWEEGLPYLDKVTFVTALDSQAELAAIQTGDIDIALTQSEGDWRRAEQSGIKTLRQASYTTTATIFNTEKVPFDDVRVRRALKLAIDEEAIVETVFDGQRAVAKGPVTESHPYYVEVDGYPTYDPAEAERLIEEYEAETGNQVKFDFDNWDPPEFQQMFTIIQQMWTAVGAEATLRPLGQADLVSSALGGNFVGQSRYNSTAWRVPPDVGLYGSFHSQGGQNISNIADPALDAAIEAALATSDDGIRREQFGIVQQRLSDLLPYLLHNVQGQAFYIAESIKGFPGSDFGQPTMFHTEDVWV